MRRRGLAEAEKALHVARVQEVVAREWKVPLSEMRSPTRRRAPVAQARQVAMYFSHVVYGVSLASVARHFGRDRTTAAHACRRVEDRRDDENFDRLLDEIARRLPEAGKKVWSQ